MNATIWVDLIIATIGVHLNIVKRNKLKRGKIKKIYKRPNSNGSNL